jgi:hypothetical protein
MNSGVKANGWKLVFLAVVGSHPKPQQQQQQRRRRRVVIPGELRLPSTGACSIAETARQHCHLDAKRFCFWWDCGFGLCFR